MTQFDKAVFNETKLTFSKFKSLVISLASDYMLKIKNFDENERKDYYIDLRVFLEKACKFTNADEVQSNWFQFQGTLERVGVSAPIIHNFSSVLVQSTPNEHHEWKTGNMHGVVVEQVRTRLGDEFPVDLSL
jgi:hypothetical protein